MEVYDFIAKVIVVGDSTVGKTCLILRYSQDIFKENFLPTIGVDFKTKTIILDDGKKLKLQLWDTAGQERFDSLRKGFYRGAKGVIVLYDITRDSSFDSVRKWLSDIANNTSGDNYPILGVFGNKLDLEEFRQVPKEEGEALAQSVRAVFGEVSAKSGENVNENFERFVQEIINQQNKKIESCELEPSIDVSKDWTRQDMSNCCAKKSRGSTSSLSGID